MKVGDIVVYIDNNAFKYSDDVYWDEDNLLIKYSQYIIEDIKKDKSYSPYYNYKLKGVDLSLNTNRFISTQEYRKLKLQKIDENWR